MKQSPILILVMTGLTMLPAAASENSPEAGRWSARIDIGGSAPVDATLNLYDGPVTGGSKLELSPGIQFDLAAGCRVTPWLVLEGEFGFLYNQVDSVGNWSYPNSSLSHMLFMANAVIEPRLGRVVPFAGAGIGGDLSSLCFGEYYWYWEPDGRGTDFVLAYQAFGGIRYEFNPTFSVGVVYRFFGTGHQRWDVDWWSGGHFDVGVDAIRVHSACVVFSVKF